MTLEELIKTLEIAQKEDSEVAVTVYRDTADDVLKFLRRFNEYQEWIARAEEVDAQLRVVEKAQEDLRLRAWQYNLPIASILRRD